MTALADLLSRADRQRLLERLAELRRLDAELRQVPDQMPPPVPPALQDMGRAGRVAAGEGTA